MWNYWFTTIVVDYRAGIFDKVKSIAVQSVKTIALLIEDLGFGSVKSR